jgi:hypothetical protein
MNFHKLLRACEGKLVAEIRAMLGQFLHQSIFTALLIALPSD